MADHPLCVACGEPFTEGEWEDRHSDPAGEDVHSHCCTSCD